MNAALCHCCEVAAPATPVSVDNRPGLSAIAYRVGTFASFRQSMLQEIAQSPALRELSSRASDDYAITVLELWSAVADVLTFYQERIANETFLRTATERDSVLRLARLIGYELGPGSAATAQLCFTTDKARSVVIPVGLRVQSVPGQDEKPQKYETLESLSAYAWLNAAQVYPRPQGINPLSRGRTHALSVPGAEGLAAGKALAVDDAVMLYDGSSVPERLSIAGVDTDGEHLRVRWRSAVQGSAWSLTTQARRWQRALRLFGYNAPAQYTVPVEDLPILRWQLRPIGTASPGSDNFAVASGDTLHLDAAYPDLKVGARLLMVERDGQQVELTVVEVEQGDQSLGPLTDTVTRIRVTPDFAQIDDRREVVLHQLEGPVLRFWGYHYPSRLSETELYLPGERTDAGHFAVGRTIDKFKLDGGEAVDLATLVKGRRLILHDPARAPIDATLHSAVIVGLAPRAEATADDPDTILDLGLATDQAVARGGVCSAALSPFPVLTAAAPVLRVRIGEREAKTLRFAAVPTSPSAAASALQTLLRGADDDQSFADCEVIEIDERLVVIPGGDDALAIVFEAHDEDETTVIELGLDAGQVHEVEVLVSDTLADPPSLTVLPAAVQISIGSIGPRTVSLSAVPASLDELAALAQSGLNAADPAPAFRYARVVVRDERLWLFAGPLGWATRHYLRLRIDSQVNFDLDRLATRLHGNIALASHGETLRDEALGDGDPTQAFQRLTLARSPVTHVPNAASTSPQSTLELLVNGMLWQPVDSLYAQAPTATVYTARLDDDARLSVTFGDGVTGARPPAGRKNIIARYRQGLGLDGRVAAATLSNLLDKPKGMKGVSNPAAADGGADAESLDEARDTAPGTVKTFDRAVSLRDFEDLVKAGGEVAKAKATWVWNRGQRAVHLTIAAQLGATFSASALTRLHASLGAGRDPNRQLLIDNYVARPIVVSATLIVDERHQASVVKLAARAALQSALGFTRLGFAESIHLSDIHATLQAVNGVLAVDVDRLLFKQKEDMSLAAYEAFLDAQGVTRLDDGSVAPLQAHLRILPARPNDAATTPAALAAEQAQLEVPEQDLILNTTGGLPD